MKPDFLKKRGKDFSILLFSFSAVLASGIFVRFTSFIIDLSKAGQYVSKTTANSKADANDLNNILKTSTELADQLKKKNVFVPPPPDMKNPVNAVIGILGDEALIDGKWYKVGDKIGEAQIAAIEPARVKVRWNGNETFFSPITAIVASEGQGGPREGAGSRPPGGPRGGSQTTVPGQGFGGPGGFPGFGNMSSGDMERFRQQRDEMRQRFENMSDEEREQTRQQMRDGFGGGNRPRRGGG